MKVKQLRLVTVCYALKSDNIVMANKDTTIEMIGGGNFLVHRAGKIVFLPSHQIQFAECEPDVKK